MVPTISGGIFIKGEVTEVWGVWGVWGVSRGPGAFDLAAKDGRIWTALKEKELCNCGGLKHVCQFLDMSSVKENLNPSP